MNAQFPTPLPPTEWQFPPATSADEHGFVGAGADLEPSTLIHAYSNAIFPMPLDPDTGPSEDGEDVEPLIGWWSPPERGILRFEDLHVSRSLRRSCRRFDVTHNVDFAGVIDGCADPTRPGGWISPAIRSAYVRLHKLGWAHSIEVWEDGALVGGLYGVQIAGLFAGESMFRRVTDASKAAVIAMVAAVESIGGSLIDVQWRTEHLATLGVSAVTQRNYLRLLHNALTSATPSLGTISDPQWLSKSQRWLELTA